MAELQRTETAQALQKPLKLAVGQAGELSANPVGFEAFLSGGFHWSSALGLLKILKLWT